MERREQSDDDRTVGYLAIDLGPTRLHAGVVDDAGEVVVRDRITTPARNVWPALTQLVSRVVAANQSGVTPAVCGVTCPGPIDRGTGAMKPVGMPIWHDFPLRRELGEVTGLPVEVESRSLMNVVWNLPTPELEAECVQAAAAAGLVGLKGHRLVGGLRASIYNAVSLESVHALCDFLRAFRK